MIASAHGRLPNPAPATLELLKGLSVYGTDLPGDLVTPTGAAILKALDAGSGPCPSLHLERVGYGAGSRDLPGHPNLLRLYLGRPLEAAGGVGERVLVLETHIDDLTPELYEPLTEGLFAAGALDVALGPLQMKKNRPGVLLTVLCAEADADRLTELILRETSSFGVRRSTMERRKLAREFVSVQTPYGEVSVKIGRLDGRVVQAAPEYEACKRLAAVAKVPLKEVYAAALRAISAA